MESTVQTEMECSEIIFVCPASAKKSPLCFGKPCSTLANTNPKEGEFQLLSVFLNSSPNR